MNNSIKKINLLTGALLKNSTADSDPFKFKGLKIAIGIFGSAIMFGCAILVGFFTHLLTEAVNLLGGNGTEACQLIMFFISIFGGVFGINVVCGLLYFSVDLSRILPYAFKPQEICMSKFIVGYLQESIMEFLVLIGILVGFMLANGVSILGIIFSAVCIVLLPILPLFYCALFAMMFMSLAKKTHSIKNVNLISALCGIVFMLIFLVSLFQLEDITAEEFIFSIVDGSNMFMNIMQYVFFTVPLLAFSISQQNILLFILFVLAHIVMIVVLYALSSKLYMLGVTAVMSAGKKHSNTQRISKKSHSMFTACFYREIKTLLRTPTYIINCIAPNALLPIIGAILLTTGSASGLKESIYSLNSPDVLIVFAVTALCCIVTAMSGLATSAFTREGNHADLLKYIPVPYKIQVNVKAVIAFVFTLPTALLGIILFCIAVECSALLTVYCIIAGVLAVFVTNYTGLLFDVMHPKLVWEDELSALRGNMSTFLHMAVAIGVGVFLGLLYFFLGQYIIIPVVLVLMLVVTVVTVVYVSKRTVSLMEEMIV